MNLAVESRPAVDAGAALVALGEWLQHEGYRFITPTPATHARVLAREPGREARSLRDVFGWSRPFARRFLPGEVLGRMREAGLLDEGPLLLPEDLLLRSKVRFSTLGAQLYAHSAYPTTGADAVFFGPDTYRFVSLIEGQLQRRPLKQDARILDMGCGAGPGGIAAALFDSAARPHLVLADINPGALAMAAANARLAGLRDVAFACGDLFGAVDGEFDFIVANPPYLNDGDKRVYRHGGGAWGGGLSERIVREGLHRLAPGGRLVLYTGAAIVDGTDPLLDSLRATLDSHGWAWTYRELDPDVFGEELEEAAYAGAERIAAVALIVERPA